MFRVDLHRGLCFIDKAGYFWSARFFLSISLINHDWKAIMIYDFSLIVYSGFKKRMHH